MAMHQTILRRRQDPLQSVKRCRQCCSSFHCTFCKSAFADFYKVKYHIENHVSIAVKHEDFVIMKCSLGCRETAHFHCCYCGGTILRRMAYIKHIGQCKEKLPPPSSLATAQAAPPPSPPTQVAPPHPPLPQAAPPPLPTTQTVPPPLLLLQAAPPPLPTTQAAPPPLPPTQTTPPPLLLPQVAPPLPPTEAAPSSSSQQFKAREQVKLLCNHCGITLNKKNLQVHIKRKHRPKGVGRSETGQLSDQCINATNVHSKPFFKSGSPIHVQEKTWAPTRRQMCESDDCKTNLKFSVRSGIPPYECTHIKTMTFSLLMTHDDMGRDGELNDDEVRAPFTFTFEEREDMELFLQEVGDKKGIRVSCVYNSDL